MTEKIRDVIRQLVKARADCLCFMKNAVNLLILKEQNKSENFKLIVLK